MPIEKYSIDRGAILAEIRADRDEWLELLGANPSDKTLAFLGLLRSTWKKIESGKAPLVPMAAYRLASFCRHGHLADIAGSAWRDFYVCGDTLALPGCRTPFTAPELRAVWCELQELPRLRREVAQLREDSDAVEVSPAVAAWLSRLGLRPLALK